MSDQRPRDAMTIKEATVFNMWRGPKEKAGAGMEVLESPCTVEELRRRWYSRN
jgi:hypothetical protein